MKKVLYILILFISVISACVTLQEKRMEYVNNNPDLTKDIKNAILNGKIITGMPPEHVRASWGDPENILDNIIENNKNLVKWLYNRENGEYINVAA